MRLITESKFESPVSGRITSPFGRRTIGNRQHNHLGVDYSVPPNTPIKSPLNGVVILSRDGYGKCGGSLEISHKIGDEEITTLYCHLNSREVNKGDTVTKGEVIGYTGGGPDVDYSKRGNSTGPHLHFGVSEVRNGVKRKVDPKKYLDLTVPDSEEEDDDIPTEIKKKIDKMGDVKIGDTTIEDLVKSGKEKGGQFLKSVIEKILKFIGLKEERELLEKRIIERIRNEKTLK